MNVVVIDDSASTQAFVRGVIDKMYGINCVSFVDPKQAMRYLEINEARLIIVDYSMPGMTGIELVKRIRLNALHFTTPTIMITTSSERAVRQRAGEVGVNDYLNKPIRAGELISRIERWTRATAERSRRPDEVVA